MAACAAALSAQAPAAAPVPCRDAPCALTIDWGVGKTMADMPPDKKYGSPEQFDQAMREALKGHDMIGVASAPDSKIGIRVVATYKTRVLCEEMPGTMPDRTCATIGEAIANFSTSDPAIKLPTAVRLINRCGASSGVMSMRAFGKLMGETIWFALEGEQQKASKPFGRC